MTCEHCDTLREVIRNLEINNRVRYAEIERLHTQLKSLRARLTRMQQTIERKNKEGVSAREQAQQRLHAFIDSNPSDGQIKQWFTIVCNDPVQVKVYSTIPGFIDYLNKHKHLFRIERRCA